MCLFVFSMNKFYDFIFCTLTLFYSSDQFLSFHFNTNNHNGLTFIIRLLVGRGYLSHSRKSLWICCTDHNIVVVGTAYLYITQIKNQKSISQMLRKYLSNEFKHVSQLLRFIFYNFGFFLTF